MLKQRLLTAGIAGLIAIPWLIWMPKIMVLLGVLAVFSILAYEWIKMTTLPSSSWRYIASLIVGMGLVFAAWNSFFDIKSLQTLLPLMAACLWIAILVACFYYRQNAQQPRRYGVALTLSAFIIIPAALAAFMGLYERGIWWLFFAIGLAVVADTAAYFGGKALGKRKLVPELSPGKTLAGFVSGLIGVLIYALVTAYTNNFASTQIIYFSILCVCCGVLSIIGDLFESLIKREARSKDSGRILPGHGGFFDRFDSHLAVLPLFFIGLEWLSKTV